MASLFCTPIGCADFGCRIIDRKRPAGISLTGCAVCRSPFEDSIGHMLQFGRQEGTWIWTTKVYFCERCDDIFIKIAEEVVEKYRDFTPVILRLVVHFFRDDFLRFCEFGISSYIEFSYFRNYKGQCQCCLQQVPAFHEFCICNAYWCDGLSRVYRQICEDCKQKMLDDIGLYLSFFMPQEVKNAAFL